MPGKQPRQSGAYLSFQQYLILGRLMNRGAMHGWGITEDIALISGGQVLLGAGTLYDNLKKMVRDGYIERVEQTDAEDGKRRKFYKITAVGEEVFVQQKYILELADRESEGGGGPMPNPAFQLGFEAPI